MLTLLLLRHLPWNPERSNRRFANRTFFNPTYEIVHESRILHGLGL